ncbi:hypothetical protein MP638_007477, partial [Amoeboaphelidium occidentale]
KNAVGVYGKEFHSCRYVALVVTGKNESTTDFHWYRLMKPNYDLVDREEWWHKPGGTPVMTTDFAGNPINKMGLEQSDRGPYTEFCSYFRTCLQVR